MTDFIGAEERMLEELESSSEPASTASSKSPTDAALRITFILAGIVATVCVLCLVFAAYSMHHGNEVFPVRSEDSTTLELPRQK